MALFWPTDWRRLGLPSGKKPQLQPPRIWSEGSCLVQLLETHYLSRIEPSTFQASSPRKLGGPPDCSLYLIALVSLPYLEEQSRLGGLADSPARCWLGNLVTGQGS